MVFEGLEFALLMLEDMLFFMATREMSSIVVLRVKEILRVGEETSWRFAEDGIFERRRLVGDVDVFFCLRFEEEAAAARSGAFNDNNIGPEADAGLFIVVSDGLERCKGLKDPLCIGAVFWVIRGGRLEAFVPNGFLEDFARVGDGTAGKSSSSSESEFIIGCHRSRGSRLAAAKMLRPVNGTFAAAVRRGERAREARDIGDGSPISISMGVFWTLNIVWARAKGVRVLFLRDLTGSTGESSEMSVHSFDDGKSPSPVPTDEKLLWNPTRVSPPNVG